MKKLFLDTPDGWKDMDESFETLEDVRAKYRPNNYFSWEEVNRFCLKVITTHNERDTMKGRDRNGWCY